MTTPNAVDTKRHNAALRIITAFAVDVVLVTLFAMTGRLSHSENLFVGLWGTAWPFLAALVVAWGFRFVWRAPFAPWPTGVTVWFVTVAGGLFLRALSGQGTALAFMLVASGVLLLLLVGWRLVAALLSRRKPGAARARSLSSSSGRPSSRG